MTWTCSWPLSWDSPWYDDSDIQINFYGSLQMHVCILNKAPGVCVWTTVSRSQFCISSDVRRRRHVHSANTHRNKSASKPAALSRFPEQTPTPSQIKTHWLEKQNDGKQQRTSQNEASSGLKQVRRSKKNHFVFPLKDFFLISFLFLSINSLHFVSWVNAF